MDKYNFNQFLIFRLKVTELIVYRVGNFPRAAVKIAIKVVNSMSRRAFEIMADENMIDMDYSY